MADTDSSFNRVREFRVNAGLTQAALAQRAGISRTAVTAIEGRRLVPSVSAALALAESLRTTVEELFGSREKPLNPANWAWEPNVAATSYWQAEINGRSWRYPAETTPMWTPIPDGEAAAGDNFRHPESASPKVSQIAAQTIVVACCDPAAGLLANHLAESSGLRMLVLQRSGHEALELLKQGKVHVAGLHLSTPEEPHRNADTVRETLGSGYHLLRIAEWQEGIATAATTGVRSARGAVRAKLRWIGRQPGSGARLCLDRLLGERRRPRRFAQNHRGVAEAVQNGWADAGVCVQLTSSEAGLMFFPIQEEAYELCIPESFLEDRRGKALLQTVRSENYRNGLGHLPGYNIANTGDFTSVE